MPIVGNRRRKNNVEQYIAAIVAAIIDSFGFCRDFHYYRPGAGA